MGKAAFKVINPPTSDSQGPQGSAEGQKGEGCRTVRGREGRKLTLAGPSEPFRGREEDRSDNDNQLLGSLKAEPQLSARCLHQVSRRCPCASEWLRQLKILDKALSKRLPAPPSHSRKLGVASARPAPWGQSQQRRPGEGQEEPLQEIPAS